MVAGLSIISYSPAEAGIFGKKKNEPPKTSSQNHDHIIEFKIVSIKAEGDLWYNLYDEKGNIRIKSEYGLFGNYFIEEYRSSNGSRFGLTSISCGQIRNNPSPSYYECTDKIGETMTAKLSFLHKSISDSCPVIVKVKVNNAEAKLISYQTDKCHFE